MSNEKHTCTKEGKIIYGTMMALSPQTLLKNMELLISLSHVAFIRNAGVQTGAFKNIGSYTPSASKLHKLLQYCATGSMYEVCQEILELEDVSIVFMTADKGALKGSHAHFVNIIS